MKLKIENTNKAVILIVKVEGMDIRDEVKLKPFSKH